MAARLDVCTVIRRYHRRFVHTSLGPIQSVFDDSRIRPFGLVTCQPSMLYECVGVALVSAVSLVLVESFLEESLGSLPYVHLLATSTGDLVHIRVHESELGATQGYYITNLLTTHGDDRNTFAYESLQWF